MQDKTILELLWRWDERALEMVQVRYGAYCGRIAANILRSHEDCEECLNDVWTRLWQTVPPARPNHLRLYLFGTQKCYGPVEIPVISAASLGSEVEMNLTNGAVTAKACHVRVWTDHVEITLNLPPQEPEAMDEEKLNEYFGSWLETAESAFADVALQNADGSSVVVAKLESVFAGDWITENSSDDFEAGGTVVLKHVFSQIVDLSELVSVTVGGVTYPLTAE